MHALILAGGLGTRMRTVTGEHPKALLPVGSRPFIEWQLMWLKLLGVEQATLALGFGGEEIREFLEDKLHVIGGELPELSFSHDGPRLLGTGGAIAKAARILPDNFLVTYGDTVLRLRLREMFDSHVRADLGLTIAILKNANRNDRSNVVIRDDGFFLYDKKNSISAMDHIDYGISVVNKDYFLNYAANRKNQPGGLEASQAPFDFADFMNSACLAHQARPFRVTEMFQEVGSPTGYERFQKFMEEINYDLSALAASYT